VRIAGFLGWREFVVAFFIVALAGSLPNLFVGVTAAFQEIPELSFGDVVGNNLVLLTLGAGLAVLFTKGGEISVKKSRTIQTTAIFTILAVILPLLLILDRELSRIDGILLITLFLFYIFWLFSKQERFTRIYSEEEISSIAKGFKIFVKDSGKVILGIILLILSAWGIIISAQFLTQSLNVPLILIGILITGLGTALVDLFYRCFGYERSDLDDFRKFDGRSYYSGYPGFRNCGSNSADSNNQFLTFSYRRIFSNHRRSPFFLFCPDWSQSHQKRSFLSAGNLYRVCSH